MKKTILASYEELLKLAMNYAVTNANNVVYPCHLFKAVLHKDMGLSLKVLWTKTTTIWWSGPMWRSA